MAIDERKLDIWFEYHPPREEQIERMKKIRKAAKHFAKAILDNTPTSSDQSFPLGWHGESEQRRTSLAEMSQRSGFSNLLSW